MSKNHQGKAVENADFRVGEVTEVEPANLKLPAISREDYKAELLELQIELVKLQRHMIHNGDKILIILEGRDAAGKDGSIKRITEYMSPRDTRVVALGKPSDRDESAWYFQRYVQHLPVAAELVLFNRSWYNRAGVERVMGFCTTDQYEEFMTSVTRFEEMLIKSGIKLFKYYLDISKVEQERRLKARKRDPLKQWKVSQIDSVAVEHWKDYTEARDEMFKRTHTPKAPWYIVRADDKPLGRLNLIRDILSRIDYDGKKPKLVVPNPSVVFEFQPVCLDNGLLAR